MKKIIVFFTLGFFLLSGCSTLNEATHTSYPITGEEQVSNSTNGLGYGATGGRAFGVIVDGDAGYYMDRQEKVLRDKLKDSGVRVLREGQSLKLIMPANVTFEVNSSHINNSFFEALNSVALVLNEYGNTRLKIYGFTDSRGSFEHNQLLSEDRARSVSSYLTHQGVNPSRLYVRGMSERFPIASNDTSDGRALNRRVELIIEPVNA